MSFIADSIIAHLPSKRKTSPSGWISFNSVCCSDKRQRGGFIMAGGGAISYHCFNCNTKASWQPGRQLSKSMKDFMRNLGMDNSTIGKLSIEALRQKEDIDGYKATILSPTFNPRALPLGAEPIINFLNNPPEELMPVVKYLTERNLYLEDYNFYWTPKVGFNNRLIIPFYYRGNIVGYTARLIHSGKQKYFSEQQPDYVFNIDRQTDERKFIIVCEGPIDAISIDGCALLGSVITPGQNYVLKQLNKEIILVPDRDHEGPKTVEKAIEYGWSVSMPDWPDGVKDVNDAIIKMGRLAALWLILQAKESYDVKIKVKAKLWFKN